ncbi:MAG: amino acid dehydrogenase, partial [Phaeodactylibacter sp.]|nr:amino acid dehydrogenase [Phaeodactylibacter sp.]
GARVVGIIDKSGAVLSTEGLDFEAIKTLFVTKRGNKLHADQLLPFETANEQIWDMGADIFIPGAASKLVTKDQVDRMIAGGLEVISCGANVPFIDDQIFFGPTAKYTDSEVSLVPDFIANCGMARVFAYLMQQQADMTDMDIFSDVSSTIRAALEEVRQEDSSLTGIATRALAISLKKIMPEAAAPILA